MTNIENQNNPYTPPTASLEAPAMERAQGDVLASRGARLGAALLDGLTLLAAAAPGIILGAVSSQKSIGGLLAGVGIVAMSIYQMYLITLRGQTIGKRQMGIQIVRVDGSALTFVHGVVLRSWLITLMTRIPYLGPVLGLVNILMIFGSEKRCLHDVIAGTRVVVAASRSLD